MVGTTKMSAKKRKKRDHKSRCVDDKQPCLAVKRMRLLLVTGEWEWDGRGMK